MATKVIDYPNPPPPGFRYEYVNIKNPNMLAALSVAKLHSLDNAMPTGSVVVDLLGKIIGLGANGSTYHQNHICERVRQNILTGQGYELCEGCHPKNHSERKAILDAQSKNLDTSLSSLYLWGHWWCCEPCWDSIIHANISHIYLLTNSEILFNKSHPKNIVGKQFDYFSFQLK